ncbi:SAF domain-containing protein [Nocardia sp. NPDC006044]|uniref:SAF domain-containing protein n=1 Tax=Nocardia sp. NPDC006044 TaxID=3364306 RepID=UPI0036C34A10
MFRLISRRPAKPKAEDAVSRPAPADDDRTAADPLIDGDTAVFRPLPAVRSRPRWGLRVVGAVLILGAVGGSLVVVHNMRATTDVLVLAKDVAQGHKLTADDLKVTTVNTDAGLQVVPRTMEYSVLGLAAARPLGAGDLLNAKMLANAVVPGADQTLVGITVAAGKLPATPLLPGDLVQLVDTPRDGDNAPVQAPITSNAQVVSVRLNSSNTQTTTVDVIVPPAEANWVAARAATGRVAIVLDSRVR